MPKVALTQSDKKALKIGAYIRGCMESDGISQEEMADELGITQPGMGYKLRTNTFTYKDLVIIFDKLGLSDVASDEAARGEV